MCTGKDAGVGCTRHEERKTQPPQKRFMDAVKEDVLVEGVTRRGRRQRKVETGDPLLRPLMGTDEKRRKKKQQPRVHRPGLGSRSGVLGIHLTQVGR